MSGPERDVALALETVGTLVVVLAALGAVTMRQAYNRLHFLTPATSLGGPLIGLALGIENGPGLTTALDEFTVFLLFLTGPVLGAATGRVAAQRDGLVPEESPS